jgi:hypothetical protein
VQGSWLSWFFPSGFNRPRTGFNVRSAPAFKSPAVQKLSQIGFFVSVDGCCCARQTELLLERANGRYFSLYF